MLLLAFAMTFGTSLYLDDAARKHLPGTGEARHVSALPGAYALHSAHHHEHPAPEPHLPPYAAMGEPLVPLRRSIELRGISHPHPLRPRLHRATPPRLLAYVPRNSGDNAAHSMDAPVDSDQVAGNDNEKEKPIGTP